MHAATVDQQFREILYEFMNETRIQHIYMFILIEQNDINILIFESNIQLQLILITLLISITVL